MQALIYVPPGGDYSKPDTCVELALKDGCILSTVQNIGAVEHTLITEDIPGVDGTHVQGVRVEPRELPCTVYVHGVNREEMYYKRFELISKLSGKEEGWLYYRNDYITVRIKARPVLPGNFTERVANYNKCDIKFHCADPYWQGLETNREHIAYEKGVGLAFSDAFTFNSVYFGSRRSEIMINCKSSTATPVRIIVEGRAEHPKLRNKTTGESINFESLSMNIGEMLIIDTTPGRISAEYINSAGKTVKAFNYLSPNSSLWLLKPGDNLISYSSDDGQNAKITIEWVNRYEGV